MGGIEVPGDHHVDNRALLGALVQACRAKGVRFVAGTVEGVSPGRPGPGVDAGPGVELSDGSRLGSDYVLLAAGTGTPHIGGLEAAGLPEIRPVKGHILRLGPADGLADPPKGLADPPHGPADPPLLPRTVRALVHGRSIYLVPRPDGTVVVGATMTFKIRRKRSD